jgi:hypothetical protein
MLDVGCSAFISFSFDLTGRFFSQRRRSYETTPSWNSEPQNIESAGGGNDEVWNRCAQSFFKNNNDRIPYFDIRYSLFQSFFLYLTGRSRPEAALNTDT